MSIELRVIPFTALALVAWPLGVARAGDAPKAPRLDVRATPAVAFPPVEVRAVGRLVGGDELERFYCPAVVWDWGDGSRSARQSDCPPFGDDTRLDRFFSAAHLYRGPGVYSVRLTLLRGDRHIAAATAQIVVRGRNLAMDDRDRDRAPAAGSAVLSSTSRRAERSRRSSEVMP